MKESTVPSQQSRFRQTAPFIVAAAAGVMVLVYVVLLTRDPSQPVFWFGFVCFGVAAAGSIYTIVTDRRSRR